MADTLQYTNIEEIIERVHRDYGFHDVDFIDALEWAGDALDKIGAPRTYIDKVTDGNTKLHHPCPISIKNYRGNLPADIHRVVGVREKSNKIPMRRTTDSFYKGLECTGSDSEDSNSFSWFGTITFSSDLITDWSDSPCDTELTYKMDNGYIFTSFKEGEVELAYKAFPCDERGYPKVPATTKYKDAVVNFIAKKMAMKKFINNKLSGDKLRLIQQECDWSIGQAGNDAKMPTLDEMESWKNQFLRLIPNVNEHATGFVDLGRQQQMYTQNSYSGEGKGYNQ